MLCLSPKSGEKFCFSKARRFLGAIFHALARQKECRILEVHVMPDHVHMCISIPPKYPVASVIGGLKGKRPLPLRESFVVGSAISPENIFGLRDMQSPPLGLSWSKFANTSAPRRKRMDRESRFKFETEGAL